MPEGTKVMKQLPRRNYPKNVFTEDWNINEFIKELQKRSIEVTLGVDATTKDNVISFNIRHRTKDKALLQALCKALFGTVKQG